MSYTLTQLRTEVRRRADMENTQFVTDAELTNYINNSYAELYDLLISKYEDYFMADPVQFTLSGTTTTYTLPSDFYKLRGIDTQDGGGSPWSPVDRFNFEDRNASVVPNLYSGVEVMYRLAGGKIRFTPEDACAGTYRLWYIPRFTPLVNNSDVLSDVMDFDEYIIVDAARKCLVKEESDTTEMNVAKNNLTTRILAMAANRDSNRPETITDVTSPRSSWIW